MSLPRDEEFGPAPPAPRCIGCGYVLTGLPSPGPCPECARDYDLGDPYTYSLKPPFVGWRYWLPGLSLAVLSGTALAGVLAASNNWGWAMWIAVPFSAGCIVGYVSRVRTAGLALLCIAAATSLIMGLMAMGLAGLFCGMALSGILLGPVFLGGAAGATLRMILKHTRFSQRSHLPVLFFVAIPLACAAVEGPPGNDPVETVCTTHILESGPDAAWDAIVFYENVTHEPPWILKIGLARPLATTGPGGRVGDERRCIYNKGHITKVITEAHRPSRLAFAVTEQQIGYERDVRLIGGSFSFRPLSPERTEVTLTTSYQPRLAPRFAWRPFEHYAVHLLHDYVLEGMAERLDAGAAPSRTLTEVP